MLFPIYAIKLNSGTLFSFNLNYGILCAKLVINLNISNLIRGKIMGKKKGSSISYLYLLGMALTVIGFCCPLFQGKVFGTTSNGFNFIGGNNSSLMTTACLLIFIGACVGLLLAVLPIFKIKVSGTKTLKLIALAVTIVGGVILVITFSGNGSGSSVAKAINKAQGKGFLKHAAYGFYMVLAGWVVSILGYVFDK